MPPAKGDATPSRGRMTAFAFYVQACREEHEKSNIEGNVVLAEFFKRVTEQWKTMADKEKERFYKMAENNKKRYNEDEMKNYTSLFTKVKRGVKRKQINDPNAPERPLSAFYWFSKDERTKVMNQNPKFVVGDIAQELGRRWVDAKFAVKRKYEAMADKDKARYEEEITAYEKSTSATTPPCPYT